MTAGIIVYLLIGAFVGGIMADEATDDTGAMTAFLVVILWPMALLFALGRQIREQIGL